MFVGKARSLSKSRGPERCFTRIGFGLIGKHQTRLLLYGNYLPKCYEVFDIGAFHVHKLLLSSALVQKASMFAGFVRTARSSTLALAGAVTPWAYITLALTVKNILACRKLTLLKVLQHWPNNSIFLAVCQCFNVSVNNLD